MKNCINLCCLHWTRSSAHSRKKKQWTANIKVAEFLYKHQLVLASTTLFFGLTFHRPCVCVWIFMQIFCQVAPKSKINQPWREDEYYYSTDSPLRSHRVCWLCWQNDVVQLNQIKTKTALKWQLGQPFWHNKRHANWVSNAILYLQSVCVSVSLVWFKQGQKVVAACVCLPSDTFKLN